jgi:hypothetical protein
VTRKKQERRTEVDASLLAAFPGLRLFPRAVASPERRTVADMMGILDEVKRNWRVK